MKQLHHASSGTESRGDVIILVNPKAGELTVQITSSVKVLFGKSIEKSVREVAHSLNVHEGEIVVNDQGALDYVLRARVETALRRATNCDSISACSE